MEFKCKSHVDKNTGEQWNIYRCICGNERAYKEGQQPKFCNGTNCWGQYVGQKFGRLTVIETSKNFKRRYVKVRCDCGTEKMVQIYDLLHEKTKSCGCLRKQLLKERYAEEAQNHVGERYGHLTILEPILKNKQYYYKCKCDCGAETVVSHTHLFNGHTSSCGCLVSKANEHFDKILSSFNLNFKREYTFLDLRSDNGALLRFDFALFNEIDELVGLVELNGSQHYQTVGTGYFTKEKLAQIKKYDALKINYCATNNIPLLIIPYQYFGDEMENFFLSSNLAADLGLKLND